MKQEGKRNRAREVEDVMELMHLIQSRLPVEDAARTSILSKSWLHAWSTIPTLRFSVGKFQERKRMKLVDVDRTLTRYLRDNIPIETFDLNINIENKESASHAEDLIPSVATKTCLKEFALYVSLSGGPALFTLPDEILSGENLTKITVKGSQGSKHVVRMPTSLHPVINCVSLRELCLYDVHISEEAFHHILSTCSLLVKIELIQSCKGFETIRVKNLARLCELAIFLDYQQSAALEISDVPNLGVFRYLHPFDAKAHSISLGSSVTQLMLGGVIPDNACLDMIKSGLPFLESLTLILTTWILESFDFTCASIKRLTLLSCPPILTDVQVHAPKLTFFRFDGCDILPNLLFPVSSVTQIRIKLQFHLPVDASFFIKMREALTLSPECGLDITILDYSKSEATVSACCERATTVFLDE